MERAALVSFLDLLYWIPRQYFRQVVHGKEYQKYPSMCTSDWSNDIEIMRRPIASETVQHCPQKWQTGLGSEASGF
eukprot:scaffold1969_cov206-Pinguiococcus_pyrenoidosus.AAC.1